MSWSASINTRIFALFFPDPAIQLIFAKEINLAASCQRLGKINEICATVDPPRWQQKSLGANIVRRTAKRLERVMNGSVPSIAVLLFDRSPFPTQIPPDDHSISRPDQFHGISETSTRFQTISAPNRSRS